MACSSSLSMAFLVNTGVKVSFQTQSALWFTSLMRVNRPGKSRLPFDPPEHPGGSCSWSQSLCFGENLLPEVILAAPSVRNGLHPPHAAQALFHPLCLSFSAISSKTPSQAPRRHLHVSGRPEMLHPFSGRKTLPVSTAGAPPRGEQGPDTHSWVCLGTVPLRGTYHCVPSYVVTSPPSSGSATKVPSILWFHHFQHVSTKASMLVCVQQVERRRTWRITWGSYLGVRPGRAHMSSAHCHGLDAVSRELCAEKHKQAGSVTSWLLHCYCKTGE